MPKNILSDVLLKKEKEEKKKILTLLSESLQLLLLSHSPTLTLMSKHLNSHAIKNTGSYANLLVKR